MAGLTGSVAPQVLVPDWPVPPSVQAACTLRSGGASCGVYAGYNLGDHVGDEPAAVAANRSGLAGAIGVRPVFLQQVHGTGVVPLAHHTPDGLSADACYTQERGVACTIMVADCLPVLLADREGSVVAAAHAGWRGLAGQGGVGVIEALVRALPVTPDRLVAWLGPCIGPRAFEVGAEVRAAFVAADADSTRWFRPADAAGKWWADLPGLARQRLALSGVRDVSGNDGGDTWCTVSQPSRFFSHRRDRRSGRFAACVWLA